MPVLKATAKNIDKAAEILRSGGLVAFPTETVYGLGANAFDAKACARIFEAKQRPSFDPLIVHVSDRDMLEQVASELSVEVEKAIDGFWPGALSLVVPKSEKIPGIVTSGLPTVAVRMPSSKVARDLIRKAGVPVAAPSANPFGYLSPTRAEHVERTLGDRVDLILDGGATQFGLESTILLMSNPPTILRHGAVSLEDLKNVLGEIQEQINEETKPLVPGQLPQHYSPRTAIAIAKASKVLPSLKPKSGFVSFQNVPKGFKVVKVLSPTGDLVEAAAHLFEALHQLDELGLEAIFAEPLPEVGLGRAMMDRLRRASVRE